MIKKLFFWLTFTLLFAACNVLTTDENERDIIIGSGRLISETKNLQTVKGINLLASGNVFIRQGYSQEIKIETDSNIKDRLITKNHDGILEISMLPGNYKNVTINIYLTLAEIKLINITGAGNVKTTESINTDALAVNVTGSGNIHLTGSGNSLDATITGTGIINAKDFRVKSSEVMVNGAGMIQTYATDELNAFVAGVGMIEYYCEPKILRTSITGLGTIIKKY